MTVFISVVNHNHDSLIMKLDTLGKLAQRYNVILKSNTPASFKLREYCDGNGIHLVEGHETKGFAANNNENYQYARNMLGMDTNSWFLILNPDVIVEIDTVEQLLQSTNLKSKSIYTISLYRDEDCTILDNSVRKFPSFLDPLRDMLDQPRKDLYNRELISKPQHVDWTAGSFMLFPSDVYDVLDGFDERYYMYYEDVDLCRRAKNLGISIKYIPQLKALHLAAYENRNLLSSNGKHYLRSYLRYFFI